MGEVPKLPPLWQMIAMVSALLAVQETAIWAYREWRSRRK